MATDDLNTAQDQGSGTAQPPKTHKLSSRFWARFKSAMWFVRSIPAGRILALVLIGTMLFSPIADGLFWQRLSSVYDDWYFDPTKEGLIVVDSPQVFTRERLVNQRLRDSAWIDRQLEAVDKKLDDGEFSKPDVLANQELTIGLLEKTLNSSASPQTGESEAVNDDAVQTDDRKLAGLKDLLQPDPISVFRDAQFYREILTQSRYESILDDAHDIGSNTLQKLNFRMTITPARRKSDSLAAVTITIEEPEEVENLFQYYGKLLIETREEVEDTVARLIRDRGQIFVSYSTYTYSGRIPALLDQVMDARFKKSFGVAPTPQVRAQAIGRAVELEQEQRKKGISNLIRKIMMENREYPGLVQMLYAETSGAGTAQDTAVQNAYVSQANGSAARTDAVARQFKAVATHMMGRNCDIDLSLLDLAPGVFENEDLLARMREGFFELAKHKRVLDKQQRDRRSASNAPEQGQSTTAKENTPEKPEAIAANQATVDESEPSLEEQMAIDEADFQSFLNARRYRATCPMDSAVNMRASLRVIGALRLLEPIVAQKQPCGGDARQQAKLVRQTLSLFMSEIYDTQPLACEIGEIESKYLIAQRPPSTSRWDIGHIGVAYLVLNELSSTPIDSMVRVRTLFDYFRFSIDDCVPLSCDVAARTLAEDKLHRLLHPKLLANDIRSDTGQPPRDGNAGKIPIKVTVAETDGPSRSGYAGTDPGLTGDEKRLIREIGREEALRLYAELSCFARARSYTVWPRSGGTKRALNRNSSNFQILGDFLSKMMAGTSASASSTSFSETQHVFGIGDGGQPLESAFAECDTPFFWMLDRFEPDGEFVRNFAWTTGQVAKQWNFRRPKEDKWEGADEATKSWRSKVICRIANNRMAQATLFASAWNTLSLPRRDEGYKILRQDQRNQLKWAGATKLDKDQPDAFRGEFDREELILLQLPWSDGIPGWDDLNCAQDPHSLEDDIRDRDISKFIDHVTIGDFMAVTRQQRDYETSVSWLVIPEQDSALTPKRHVAKSVPLSAIVSLPSWWPSAKITVRTCWLRPKMIQHHDVADFCRQPATRKDGIADGHDPAKRKAEGYGSLGSDSVFPVRLPSNAQDVLQKLGFFIIRAPYLDIQGGGAESLTVQAGRPAEIRLTGKRLWKNPRVRLGNQWHTEIEVLPDMKGIIAKFECVPRRMSRAETS